MCQSKADGGLRCASHVTTSMYAHADKQIKMVKEFAKGNGLDLPAEETLYSDFTDHGEIYSRASEKPAFLKAQKAYHAALQDGYSAESRFVSVVAMKNPSSVAAHMWQRDPQVKEWLDKRNRALDANDEKATGEAVSKLKGLRLKITSEAEEIVQICRVGKKANLIATLEQQGKLPADISDLKKKEKEADAEFAKVRKELMQTEKARLVSRRMRENENFKAITKKVAFRVQPEVQAWEKKQKEYVRDYSMTSEYREKMEALATHHPEGSPERENIASELRKVEILKDLTVRKNKREAAEKSA